MIAAVMLSTVVTQTLLAQALDERGDRRVQFVLQYLEVATPGTVLLFISGLSLYASIFLYEALFRLIPLVLTGLFWDQAFRRPCAWRNVVVSIWLLAGLGLAAWYFQLLFAVGAVGGLDLPGRNFPLAVIAAVPTAAAVYGIFVQRWRWYVRVTLYLGYVPVVATVVYLGLIR